MDIYSISSQYHNTLISYNQTNPLWLRRISLEPKRAETSETQQFISMQVHFFMRNLLANTRDLCKINNIGGGKTWRWISHESEISRKIHPCGSDVRSEFEHRSLRGRYETRTVNLEEQSEKSARPQSERTENPVGDTAGSVRRATGMEMLHNYYVS